MLMKNRQRGMTLTETLLAVSVSMIMLTWIAKMQAQSAEDMRAKMTADQIQSIRNYAVQYYKANKSALVAAMDAGTNATTWCAQNNTTKKLCLVDVSKLISNGVASPSTKAVTQNNHKIYVSYRLVDPASGRTEILVFGATNGGAEVPMKDETASLSAQMMGESGGIIPSSNLAVCSTTEACGTAGSWKVNLNDFITTGITVVQGSVASYGIII